MLSLKIVKDTERSFPVLCNRCYWQGPSSKAAGGHSIADTGDYSDVECPVCYSSDLDDDYQNKYSILKWIAHQYLGRREERQLRKYISDMEKMYEKDLTKT